MMSREARRVLSKPDQQKSNAAKGLLSDAEYKLTELFDVDSLKPSKLAGIVRALRQSRPQPRTACYFLAIARKVGEHKLIDDAYAVIEDLEQSPLAPWLLNLCSGVYSEFAQYRQAAVAAVSIDPRGSSGLSYRKYMSLREAAYGLARNELYEDSKTVIEAVSPNETDRYNQWVNGLRKSAADNLSTRQLPMIEMLASFTPKSAPIPIEYAELIQPGTVLAEQMTQA